MTKKLILNTLLLTCLTFTSLGMTTQLSLTEKMSQRLKVETDQYLKLKYEVANLQTQLLIQKKVDRVVKYYKVAGTFDMWGLSRDYILDWFVYCEKWKFIAGEDNWDLNITDVMVGIIHNETNGKADCRKLEWDKTYSYGITQINEKCIKDIEKELDRDYPELRGKDLKTNVEKNIAGRFMWIKHRKEAGRTWALMANDRGWLLYWYLSQVKL